MRSIPKRSARPISLATCTLHDLGFFGPYCAGWDLRQLLTGGLRRRARQGGIQPCQASAQLFRARSSIPPLPPRARRRALRHGAALTPIARPLSAMTTWTIKPSSRRMQEFIFNLNVPTRVGFQCPFSNLTFDIKPPGHPRDQAVIIGGVPQDDTYGEFQKEMDMINTAFCEVMMEGDKKGRVFTFPIPTINVTADFEWDSPVINKFMEITCKYGIPYFSNYINSDLSPEDALSMCCRLRLNTRRAAQAGRRPLWLQSPDRLHRRCHHQPAPAGISLQNRRGIPPAAGRSDGDGQREPGDQAQNH